MYDHHTCKAEKDQISDPDPSMEVHWFLAIVPPAGMEDLFQDQTG